MHPVPMPTTRRRARFRLATLFVATVLVAGACSKSDGTTAAKSGGTTSAGSTAAKRARATSAPEGGVASAKAVPSKGCGTSTVGPVHLEKQLLGSSDRYWLLTTPEEHDGKTPLPLVVDFHGLLEGAEVHAKNSMMDVFGSKHGFVVATPNGTGSPVHWEVANDTKANADLVFVRGMLDQLESDLCLDTSRVYATGLSNGAFLTSTIGCTMADRFTAIAPVSGLTFTDGCRPSRPIPVLTFHGTEDPILLFNGGVGDRLNSILSGSKEPPTPLPKADLDGAGYPEAARKWAKTDGCSTKDTEKPLTKSITQRTFDCPADTAVVFDIIAGGGHTWPGAQFSVPLSNIMGATDLTIDANAVIWKFFQRFARPAT
ncbi:MAG: poly(3-hydroxybutyrate) depolymerase [Acidimicrobiales bacterium]|nr:poly(3-hydroxybutyrate) depolymerase [Acidimicrobiales bacterium]